MRQGLTLARRLTLAAGLLASAAYAHTPPQWSRGVAQAERRDDSTITRQNWASTADGGSVVGSAAALRRFRADGVLHFVNTLLALQAFGRSVSLIVARDEAAAATYAAATTFDEATTTTRCALVRVDDSGLQQWAVEAGGSAAGACTALTVAADGSAIVARERALARVDRSGQLLWSRADLHTRTVGIGRLLLIDAYSRIVTARYESGQAHLVRYGLDGAPLGDIALPAAAPPTTIHGLDALPNGDIAVTGREDLTGVLYLLTPVDTLRLLQRSADPLPYTRSVNDGATIYVQAGDSQPPGAEQVRAIDALSGGLRWQVPAKEVVSARASGVVIVQRPIQANPAAMQLVALDTYANGLWSRPLPLGPNDLVHGGSDANGNPRLLALPLQRQADCGTALTVLALSADGTTQARHAACTEDAFAPLRGLDADSSNGVLLLRGDGVEALGPSGSPRWSLFDCPYCAAAERVVTAVGAALHADGGAWVLRYNRNSGTQYVERRSRSGGLNFIGPLPDDFANQGLLHARGSSARIVGSSGNSLRLMILTDGIGLHFGPEIVVPGTSALRAPRTRQLPDGDIMVDVRRSTCGFPACQPEEATLLRLAPDGSERWRLQSLMYSYGTVLWNDDGSALLLNRYPSQNLRYIDPQGVAGAPQALGFAVDQVIGPSQGRWLARAPDGALFLGDAQGAFTAVAAAHPIRWLLTAGSQGFLVDALALQADAALLEPQQLALQATFDTRGLPYLVDAPTSDAPGLWRLLDDGSVYGETVEPLPPANSPSPARARLSRFAVPGGVAGDLVFADAFE